MTKREIIYNKFNGRCAYSGRLLEPDWQIDHMTSKLRHENNSRRACSSAEQLIQRRKEVNDIKNLMPTIKIINHYKRALDLEGFRVYMLSFHKRLAKLPKNTSVLSTQKRKEYLFKVAAYLDITIDKPFSGIFYFEKIKQNKQP